MGEATRATFGLGCGVGVMCAWDDCGMTTGLEGLAYPEFSLPPYHYVQSPVELLDRTVPWGDWLAGLQGGPDTIVSATFVGDPGLVLTRVSFTDTSATVWVSGGLPCFLYKVVNTVTTAGGRIATRALYFKIKRP